MNIGNKYKIESDNLNITLFEKGKTKTGKVKWEAIGYFATIKNALKFLIDLGVRETQLADLKTIIDKQGELYTLIDNLQVPSSTHKQSATGGIKVKSNNPVPKTEKGGLKYGK